MKLRAYMERVNDEVAAFDQYVEALSRSTESFSLGQGFFGGWATYVYAEPATVRETNPSGWATFFGHTYPSVTPEQHNPGLWEATTWFENELVRFYDAAIAGGAPPPPFSRPTAPSPEQETSVQLPNESAPAPAGWLLRRMIACDLEGPDGANCIGVKTAESEDLRALAAITSRAVKAIIVPCPERELGAELEPLATATATAVYFDALKRRRGGELPPYDAESYFYLQPAEDVRRYAAFRRFASNENHRRGCRPVEPPRDGPVVTKSEVGVGALFVVGGLALLLASRQS